MRSSGCGFLKEQVCHLRLETTGMGHGEGKAAGEGRKEKERSRWRTSQRGWKGTDLKGTERRKRVFPYDETQDTNDD